MVVSAVHNISWEVMWSRDVCNCLCFHSLLIILAVSMRGRDGVKVTACQSPNTLEQTLQSAKAVSNANLKNKPWYTSVAILLSICYVDIVTLFDVCLGCSLVTDWLSSFCSLKFWTSWRFVAEQKVGTEIRAFSMFSCPAQEIQRLFRREGSEALQRGADSKACCWFWPEWWWGCHWCPSWDVNPSAARGLPASGV